jgi:hypothetical protein
MSQADKDVRKALKTARQEDERNPIVLYVAGTHQAPKRYCRVCGPRHDNAVPIRAQDLADAHLPFKIECEDCKQPAIRP